MLENEQQNHNISNTNLNEEIKQNSIVPHTLSKKKKFIIIGSISFTFVAIIVSLVCYFKFRKGEQQKIAINQKDILSDQIDKIDTTINVGTNKVDIPDTIIKRIPTEELKFEKEVFVTKKAYPSNRLFIFSGEQLTEMKIEGEKINETNSYRNFSQSSDFIFITRDSFSEKNKETLTEKIWYTGYIAIFNLIIPNTTHDNHLIYDKNINDYLNISKIESSSRDIYYVNNGSNYCFAKIEFYHNGEIKNIYLPEGFLLAHYSYIKENIKLIIPKISQNLYVDSIENKLNEIIENNNNIEDIYESDMTDLAEKDEEEDYLRNLNLDKKIKKKYLNRRLSDDNNNNSYSNNSNGSEISYTYEDFLTQPLSKSINYEFRQANTIDNFDSYSDFSTESFSDDYTDIDNLNNNNNSYSNLTECSMKSIENDELKLEGGMVNTTIYSIIDNEGFLKSVIEKSSSMMKSPEEQGNDKIDEETYALYTQVYNNDNQISLEQVMEDQNELLSNNNISFGISNIYTVSSNIINCTDHFINEEINKKLYDYFDNFKYELYNETINKTDIINNFEDIDNNRYLSEEENSVDYYGMKNILYMKQLYKNNLLGMKMEGQVYSEMDPSTGKMCTYSIISFGNKNTKIKVKDQISNTHIILERSNQMGYHLLKLIEQTNNELIQRNENYSEIIIEFENNFTRFFKSYYDYSPLFRKSLNDLYAQVQNFSGEFFGELIELINRVYYNYTIILKEVRNDKYDFINRIRNVTKEEYIKYIYDMIDILNNFENKTLKFLDDIDNELDNIEDFQIDLLYDIIAQIYEAKLIFKKFNRNLFNSIEKGILTFKCDINDHIDNIIGELLYITDFLSININKNDILIRVIDENTRKDVSIKLKNFRNIILIIMDSLINYINNDFGEEMNIENSNSIKYISNKKALEFLSNTEIKSENVINKIKAGIDNINIYEAYSKNIDIINDLNNKTFIEYINDIYSNVIYKVLNITPEYLDENSNINKNIKILFNISNNITNIINKEIKEINNYIFSYSNQYIEKNIYNIHYNLYYFRKYFLDDEMSRLLNEFHLLLNRTIKEHLIKMIDYNFGLANQVFKEENDLFSKKRHMNRRFLTSEFVERYHKYEAKFEQYLYLIYSEDFLNLLEKYFYKLRDDILNHVKNKIFSINVSYFNHEYYNKTFYFNEQSNNEILKIIDNINNYYNELNIDTDIKIKAVNLAQEILQPYHDKKIKELDEFYDLLYARTTDYHIKSDEKDFCYSYWKYLFFGWKNVYVYTKHHNNINLVLEDLNRTDEYLLNETNIIFNNFISKIDKYLNKYVFYCNNLYRHLDDYVENKINNSSTKIIIENYFDTFNNMIISDLNKGLLSKINTQLNYIKDNIDICINKSLDNIKLLKDQYYKLYYLPNYTSFLEYPEEIIYKINQFYSESLFNIDNIKTVVNYIYQKRINYTIKSTNTYIIDFVKKDIQYIKVNINTSYIFEKYFLSKYNELDNLYNECNKKNNFFDPINNSISFSERYEEKIKINVDYISDFILFLENITNEFFMYDVCGNISDTTIGIFYNEIICHKEKKAFDLSYSKYNYNIIKIRTGIYYTRTLIENIDTLFDEFDFRNIINNNKIQINDELLNDKNILEIYNKTNYKIKEINKESENIINETYGYFLEDFKSKYTFENDYLPFVEKMKNIIKFEDDNYTILINNILNETNYNIISLVNEFNQIFSLQISLRENYSYYNFDKYYFKDIYYIYESNIKNMFNKYRGNISNLNNNYIFHNGIKTILSKLQLNKRKYIRDIINYYSKNYDFELLNISYNLGEKLENHLEKEYNDYEFSFIYNYVEIFENYTEDYIHKIIKYINTTENKTIEIFENIYNNFYNELETNASSFINPIYIKQLKNNQTRCEFYRNYTESEYFKNDNYSNYNNINNIIDYIFSSCLEFNGIIENNTNNNYTLNLNYTLSEKILYISNISNNCSGFFFDLQNDTYYNDTLEVIECYNNDYYILNYNFIYFYNFSDVIEESIYKISDKMNDLLIKNRIDENLFYKFLENKNYTLVPYDNIDLSDILINFEDIESMINYINIIKKEEYKNCLYDNLIISFNSSYAYFIDNFILDELIDDIIISINNRLEIHLDYMARKIKDEYEYYLLILNATDELGYSSKMALINLYEIIKLKLNETIFYLFEDDINFYLNLFYRENKKMFRNNFLNYYINNKNGYNTTIYKMEKFSDELILSPNFNKTLDKISEYLIFDKIISKIKEKINNTIYTKVQNLYNISETYKIHLEKILNNITTRPLPPDMNLTNELIINYTNLVNNQKNRYYLNISDKPFNILTEFIEKHLEPPLTLIKEQYRTIEERLLNETFSIINKFPNYYLVVKQNLNLEMMNENITPYINYANETIYDYLEILDKDIKSYINKLIHYTYISGLYYIDSPCRDSFCLNESEILDNDDNTDIFETDDKNDNSDNIRRLEQNGNRKYIFNGLFNFKKLDKEKINKLKNKKLRNLEEYNSSMGAVTENDINSFILDMQDILYNFNQSYLNVEFRDIERFYKSFMDKINNTYLFKLQRSIEMVGIKFKTIFTEECYKIFENKLFSQYNGISLYIYNYSNLIEKAKNKFINTLNYSSILIGTIFDFSYMKINTYYRQFYKLIQDKTKYIDAEEAEEDEINIMRLLSQKDTNEKEEANPAEVYLSEPLIIKKNKEGKEYEVYSEQKEEYQKISEYFNNLFDDTKKESLYSLKEGESKWEAAKKQLLKYYNEKDFFDQKDPKTGEKLYWQSIKNKIESFFKKQVIDTSVGGQCTVKNCNLMVNFCFTLFKVNFGDFLVFPLKILPYLDLVITIMPSIKSDVCFGIGSNINTQNNSDSTFDIDISGGASVGITLNFGIVFPDNRSPIRLSLNIGFTGIIGAGRVGFKLSVYYTENRFKLDMYTEFKAFEASFYVMFTLSFSIQLAFFKIEFGFSFYILQKTYIAFRYEYHKIKFYDKKTSKKLYVLKEKIRKGLNRRILPLRNKI